MNVTHRIDVGDVESMQNSELPELEAALRSALDQFQIAVQLTVSSAVTVGGILCTAQEQIPEKSWSEWLGEHFPYTAHTARKWMRLYHYRDLLDDDITRIDDAANILKGLPRRDQSSVSSIDARLITSLKGEGLSNAAIARHVGVASLRVRQVLDPKGYAEYRRRDNRRRRDARAAHQRELHARTIKRLIRSASKELSEAYSLLRKQTEALDRAIEASDDVTVRSHLRKARDLSVRAEREIIKGLELT